MISFMVVGLPRSGTTWASNWLTTDATHCVHDPLYTTHYKDWDLELPRRAPGLVAGVACTGIWRWTDWINRHPARKVVLRRDYIDVCRSLVNIGLPELRMDDASLLDSVDGLHVPHTDLFDTHRAAAIWAHLVDAPFNAARHKALATIEMQPKFSGLSVGRQVTRKLMTELYAAVR